MKRPVTISIASAVLMLFALLGALLPGWLGLESPLERWILRGGLWLLGLIGAALVFWWLKSRESAPAAEPEGADEIDVTVSAAKTRLAGARGKAGARFGRLPLILVTGPAGAAKTTVVTRSGMEPELLAGEVYRGDAVVPTQALNVWFAQNHLVVEAGGRIASDAGRWRRMLRHVQPNRLAAVFSKGKQAPRLVVVCFGCDDLLKPGAAESVPAAAQKLRARLAEVAQQLGIRLPVYVLFTKADRLPYFEDFVRNLTRDEAHDVLGATLPILPSGNVGQYAERESRRLSDAFHSVFRGLAMRRLDVMPRETQDLMRAGVYEFAREFRKVESLATQFMLDLCRPSQLGVSPFLRGFYFTGVRAVFMHDAAAPHPPQPAAGGMAMDATGVFDPRMLQRGAAPATPAAGSRKVPEWTFLDRVFKEVVLRDGVAQGVTGGGTKVNFLRRVSIGTVAASFFMLSILMTRSFCGNRDLLNRTRLAVEGSRSLVRTGPLPDLDALQRLDALRVQSEALNRWARQGNPLRLNWGLYAGNRAQPEIRRLYFERFDTLLWDPTRSALNGWLAGLPPTPAENSSYDASYDALKAYLVTTALPDSARADFLAPVLMRHWQTIGAADSVRQGVAHAQFGFFADELPHGNPFPHQADQSQIQRTRGFLRAFSGADQLYRYLLTLSREGLTPVRWPDATVRNEFVVPGEFTRPGWDKAQLALSDVQRLLNREPWVVGEAAVSSDEMIRLERALRDRYTAEYVATWIRFLNAGSVAPFSGVGDAATKLRTLTSNPYPLLGMIGIASSNTNVDTVLVGKAFSPSHTVAAPSVATPTEAGGKYIASLTTLQGAVQQVSDAQGAMRDQAQMQASTAAQMVRGEVSALALTFDPQGQAQIVGAAIRRLLESPIINAESAIGRVSIDEMNAGGAGFCQAFRQVGNKFPFNPRASTEATIDEVSALFAPGSGALWTFYNDRLQNLLSRQGSQYVPRVGVPTQLNPGFVTYFNYLAQVSTALYNENVEGPQLFMQLRMQTSFNVPDINLTLSRPLRFTQTQPTAPPFEWNGAPSPARLVARVENDDVVVVDVPAGPWAVFRLFYAAALQRRSAGLWTVTWRPPGQQVAIAGELSMEDGLPILQSGSLSRVGQCVATIAR